MSNEKINNIPRWKEKLEDPNAYQNEIFSRKNLVWERLYGKLFTEQNTKGRFLWLKFAAASLLLLITVTLYFNYNKNQSKSIVNKTISNKSGKQFLPYQKNKEDDHILVKDNHVIQQMPLPKNARHEALHSNQLFNHLNTVSMQTSNELSHGIIPVPDTISRLSTFVLPKKKKNQVVSINELDDQPFEKQEILVKDKNQFFYLKFNYGKNSSSSIATHSSPDLIKVKLTTQN